MDYQELAEQVKALSDGTRLRIVELLPKERSCGEADNVSELAEELALPQPTISHHLKVLKQAGLVRCDKMCRDVYYWVDAEALSALLTKLGKTAHLPE